MARETIRVKCKGSKLLSIDEMHQIQGNLKDLSADRYAKLKKSILDLGISEAPSVWFDGKKWCILNGTQRHRTLRMMRDEGFQVPKIPVCEVEAVSLKEAMRKILALTSQYGEMTEQGLYEFISTNDMDVEDVVGSFEFPEIDMPHFKASFFDDPVHDDADGSKELTRDMFGGFKLQCPRCGFSYNAPKDAEAKDHRHAAGGEALEDTEK